nr:protein FAN-like [Leptinotarsa decemlineata]
MEKERFSLLQLDPGEIYFEDFSAIFIPPDTTPKTYETKKQDGRLKMCSKSLIFDPKDINKPIVKIPFKDCVVIEQWKGSAKFLNSNNVLSVNCREYIELLEKNVIAPYQFKGSANFLFLLNYANITNCLPQISQLHRASSLPAAEQSDMIATIVHSRQCRDNFDPRWMDLYEKIIMDFQADKITPLVVNPGRIVLTSTKLYFQPYNQMGEYPLKIDLRSIKQIVKRRFLLRHIGLEIYSNANSTNHTYFSLRNQSLRDTLYEQLLQHPELKLNDIQQDVMTLQWQNGVISNYDYLLYINSLGDRTVNDLTQYPVFPWIISNYTSRELDLDDSANYRDLSKPVGALNSTRLSRLLERYNEMPNPKFLYGSHYSTPGFVLYYLARLYPHYVLCLQSGRFDHPDRMFNAVADAYKNCLSNMSDFKELIPEFYDVAEGGKFLLNNMGINFGYRHNNVKVGDVQLPPWAQSPSEFVNILREALESDIVSKNLHKKRLFYHLCYEGAVDLDSIPDLNERHALEVQIMEFGQIPKQVFKVPHPRRKLGDSIPVEPYQIHQNKIILDDQWKNAESLDLHTSFKSHKNTVSHLFINENGTQITSVGHDSKLKIFSLSQNKQIRSASIGNMPLSSCIQLPNINKLVVASWDNEISLYDLDYGRVTENVLAHEDAITCMSFGYKNNLLVSGSGDCTVKIWKGLNSDGVIKPIQCLHKQIDHNSQVNCLTFNVENDHLAVGTEDGDVYIWEMNSFTDVTDYQLLYFSGSVKTIDISPQREFIVSGSQDRVIKVWKPKINV